MYSGPVILELVGVIYAAGDALVIPVCTNETLFRKTGAACAVFVSDPDGSDETDEEALHLFYGLTAPRPKWQRS